AVLAVAVGIGHRVEDLLLGLAVEPGPLAAVALRALEDNPALLLDVHRTLDACHRSISLWTAVPGFGYLPCTRFISPTSALAFCAGPASRGATGEELCSSRCCRLARSRITLPLRVILNRLAAPLCVFIFGMVAVVSSF